VLPPRIITAGRAGELKPGMPWGNFPGSPSAFPVVPPPPATKITSAMARLNDVSDRRRGRSQRRYSLRAQARESADVHADKPTRYLYPRSKIVMDSALTRGRHQAIPHPGELKKQLLPAGWMLVCLARLSALAQLTSRTMASKGARHVP
jgi:hypothetical protein